MCALVIRVDLRNWDRRQEIQELLCNKQYEDRNIDSIIYDERRSVVLVSGTFNPNNLRRYLISKLRDKINGIDIQEPPPPPQPQPPKEEPKLEPPPPPSPPPRKEESKPPPPPAKEESKPPPPPPPEIPKPTMYPWPPKHPMYPWPPQVTTVCFVCPCPCMTAWANNYRCCSCGVERWPGRCGCGSGSRWRSGPRHGDRPQCGCAKSQQPNIGYESTASIGYDTANFGYESTPSIGYESTEPSCSIM